MLFNATFTRSHTHLYTDSRGHPDHQERYSTSCEAAQCFYAVSHIHSHNPWNNHGTILGFSILLKDTRGPGWHADLVRLIQTVKGAFGIWMIVWGTWQNTGIWCPGNETGLEWEYKWSHRKIICGISAIHNEWVTDAWSRSLKKFSDLLYISKTAKLFTGSASCTEKSVCFSIICVEYYYTYTNSLRFSILSLHLFSFCCPSP